MAKMRSRTEALVNAYLNNYQNANATTVSGGQSAQQSAQSRGSAIMNATDKTLPTLKDYSADVLNGIVKSADNAQSTAISNFKLAKKQIEAEQKAAEKAAKAAAKSSGKSGSKKSSKKSSSTSSSTDDASGSNTSLDSLFGSGENASTSSANSKKSSGGNYNKTRTSEERNASARARYEDSKQEKSDIKYRAQQKAAAAQKALEEKQAAANAGANKGKTAGKTYAEQKNAGNTVAKPATSAFSTKDYTEAKTKNRSVGSRAADLAKGTAKQTVGAILSFLGATAGGGSEANKQAQYKMRQMIDNGTVFTADGTVNEEYQKALDQFENTKNDQDVLTEQFVPALRMVQEGNEQVARGGEGLTGINKGLYSVAAMGANMAPGMALGLVNPALGAGYMGLTSAGQKLSEETGKGMGSRDALLRGAASGLISTGTNAVPIGEFANITKNGSPILQAALKEGVENAGQEAADYLLNTAADYALKDPDANFSLRDMASQVGMGAATGAAFGALGGALNRAGSRAGLLDNGQQDALPKETFAPDATNMEQSAVPQNVPAAIAQNNTAQERIAQQADNAVQNAVPKAMIENNTADAYHQNDILSSAYADDVFPGMAANEAKQAVQNSDSLPIDAQGAKAYNEVNGGVVNDNLGAGVRADVPGNTVGSASAELQPGKSGDGLSVANGAAGQNSAASVHGQGVQGNDAKSAEQVAEWAKSITGKGRQSVYTRRIENLYNQMQNGASRESMAEEAANIAARLVKESDFAEPLDEATSALREYMKNTPIRLDEKAAGDILYTSGLKNIQQYNFQNGTKFSLTDGIPYDTAMQELGEMGVGVNGSSVDDLLKAVDASNAKPLVDSDMAAAHVDYWRDRILDGPSDTQMGAEDFADWLDVQSFDRDAPDYVQRLLERDNIPALNQTADAVSEPVPGMGTANSARQAAQEQPLNGSESVPENAIGAERTQYNREEVPNLDYANQRVMQGDMDAATATELGIGQQTHTVYSRAEGRDTAAQDFDVLVQQTGSVTDAGRTVADELNQKVQDGGKWDAADVYRGYYTADKLQQQLKDLPADSAEAEVVKAQIANINRAVSAGNSKAAQTLGAGRWAQPDEYTALRKFDQAAQERVDDFAKTRQGKQLHDFAETVANDFSGPMDDEFTAYVHSQDINTGDDISDQLEYLADQIRRAAQSRNVNISEDQARAAAASLKAGGTIEDIYNNFARKSLGIEDLTQEDYDYVVNAFHEIKEKPDSKERYKLEVAVYDRLAKYMPAKSWKDKFNNIRYFAMLGNTRTHMNNIMGNVTMKAAVVAKDNVAGIMQLALPKNERTKAIGTTLTADGRKMVDAAKQYAESDFYSVLKEDGKWNTARGLDAAKPTFGGNPNAKGFGKVTNAIGNGFQRMVDLNGKALDAEDYFFLKSTFANSMASDLKAKGYTSEIFTKTDDASKSILRSAAARAFADAQEATFHTASPTAQWLNSAPDAVKAVVEGVLPFKKTPINIARASIDYSPVGFAKAAKKAYKGAAATDVIDQTAKAITGTAVMAGGYLLAKSGLLHGSSDDDDRAANYDEMTGKQDYSVELPKELGGGTYTLDWMSPMAAPLLVGAEIANLGNGEEYGVGRMVDAFAHITEPVFDTTMLQSLNSGLQSIKYAPTGQEATYFATNALGSLAQQFVPTASGQIARTFDPVRRDNYGGGQSKTERDLNYNLTKIGNKIPWVREQEGSAELPVLGMTATKSNEPYIDLWGRETNNFDWATGTDAASTLKRGAYTMLSPGFASKENITPVDEYLQGLYGSTNDSHVLPEKVSSKITVDSENYYMTPEEKTEYAKTSGQTAYDIIDSLRQNDMFLKLPEDQQSALVQDAYSVAKTVGGVAAVGDGVSGTGSKAYEAYQQGGVPTLESYLLAKNATDIARDEKRETTGKNTTKLTDVEAWNTLYSQFGDDAIPQFVDTTDDDSAVRRIDQYAGDNGVSAYMRAYSAVANTLEKGQTPNKYYVGIGMQKYGLNGEDFARAYLAAYSKTDKKGAEMYEKYGVDGLKGWVEFKAYADADGNGHLKKTEVTDQLNKMSLTEQLYNAYYNAAMGK